MPTGCLLIWLRRASHRAPRRTTRSLTGCSGPATRPMHTGCSGTSRGWGFPLAL
uniref:Uncharacterized protein n=1 Tax=Arundo donax TaxID=35708 RepID=A0A0A9G618_ARUDO